MNIVKPIKYDSNRSIPKNSWYLETNSNHISFIRLKKYWYRVKPNKWYLLGQAYRLKLRLNLIKGSWVPSTLCLDEFSPLNLMSCSSESRSGRFSYATVPQIFCPNPHYHYTPTRWTHSHKSTCTPYPLCYKKFMSTLFPLHPRAILIPPICSKEGF